MGKKKIFIIGGSVIIILIMLIAIIIANNNKPITYNVSFETDGGTQISSQIINQGEKVVKPDDPKKEGYIFIEWLYEGKSYDFSLEVTSNFVLTAKWQEQIDDVETFIVIFDSDGGTTIPNQIIEKGGVVKKPQEPTKEGYTFKGWQLNNNDYKFDTIVESNLELKAKWEKTKENNNKPGNNGSSNNLTNNNSNSANSETNKPIKKQYTVTFDSKGGNSIESQKITEGSIATKPGAPTKAGYTFIEWQLNGTTYNFNNKVMNDIKLEALWLKTPTVKYEEVGNDIEWATYDVSIDYQSYRVGDKNILSGWELYVTSDNAEGDEIYIDGIGYFKHSTNGNEAISPADVDYGDTHRYRARVYKDTENGRIYSDWSNIIEITPKLKAPVLKYEEIGRDTENITYDVSIDYQSYRVGDKNILSGWELYVTSDNAEGDEIYIDGIGYFKHSTNGNETISPADVDYGDTHRYRARVYKDTENGRIYSDWSNTIEMVANY